MVKVNTEKVECLTDQFIETQEKINHLTEVLTQINKLESEKVKHISNTDLEIYEFIDSELTLKIAKLVNKRRELLDAIKANL